MWLSLNNKVCTWDSLQKWNKSGHGWCSLYKARDEYLNHLLISCFLSKHVWKELDGLDASNNFWHGEFVEECFKAWVENATMKTY